MTNSTFRQQAISILGLNPETVTNVSNETLLACLHQQLHDISMEEEIVRQSLAEVQYLAKVHPVAAVVVKDGLTRFSKAKTFVAKYLVPALLLAALFLLTLANNFLSVVLEALETRQLIIDTAKAKARQGGRKTLQALAQLGWLIHQHAMNLGIYLDLVLDIALATGYNQQEVA